MIRDISHHLLELTDNSLNAGATLIDVCLVITDSIAITVTDDGYGISDDVITAVTRGALVERMNGRGRGLSIVRDFVVRHGGRMDIRRADGTEISITLPIDLLTEFPIGKLGDTLAVAASASRVRLRYVTDSVEVEIDSADVEGDSDSPQSIARFREIINKYTSPTEDRLYEKHS